MAKPDIVITSALPYANGPIHIGYVLEAIQTDIYARFCRLIGKNVAFCCADDTHGTPVEIKAKSLNIKPEELIERMNKEHQEDLALYNISYDSYYTTHSQENRFFAEKIFKKLKENGYIYEQDMELMYDEKEQRFLPDRYVKGTCPKCNAEDQYGDNCSVCGATYEPVDLINPKSALSGTTPIKKTSRHFFFKLTAFETFLREWLASEKLQPEIRNQLLNWIEKGLNDWCISRDGPYFGWPIPDSDKYFYVWLDAPIGYIASLSNLLGKDLAEDTWNTADVEHFIGKDIIYFHLLFWPAVLKGAGFKPPTNVIVHGFLTINGEKMSKSKGTFLTAKEFADLLPDTEFLRFYYAANLSHAMTDLDLNLHDLTERVNKELVGNVSNFAYRTLSFVNKNFPDKLAPAATDDRAKELLEHVRKRAAATRTYYETYEFRKAVQEILHISQLGNQYFQECEPWKTKDAGVLTLCVQLVRDLAILFTPIMPQFSEKVREQLGLESLSWDDLHASLEGTRLADPSIIWQKIDPIALKAGSAPDALQLIAATITKVEPHPDAERLFIEHLDDGSGNPRQIVSGLVGHYSIEELTGKTIILINNLKPAKLRGVLSQGMLLAADKKNMVEVLEVDAPPGTPIMIKGYEQKKYEISIDDFSQLKLRVIDHQVMCNGSPLLLNGNPITAKLENGKVR